MSGENIRSWYERIALFPLFTITSAYLASIFWRDQIPDFITSQWVLYTGLGLIIVAILLKLVFKLHNLYVYDIFLVSCLCIWVVYWQKEYTFEAPVFQGFSIYFVLINLLFARFAQVKVFAEDQLQLLQFLNKRILLKPALLAALTLVALYIQSRYMLFPMFASMLMIGVLLALYSENFDSP